MVELGVQHVEEHAGHRVLPLARVIIVDTNEGVLVILEESQALGTRVRLHFLEPNTVLAIGRMRNKDRLFRGEVTQFERLRERV